MRASLLLPGAKRYWTKEEKELLAFEWPPTGSTMVLRLRLRGHCLLRNLRCFDAVACGPPFTRRLVRPRCHHSLR